MPGAVFGFQKLHNIVIKITAKRVLDIGQEVNYNLTKKSVQTLLPNR